MVTLFLCDGGDARVDLLRVLRRARQHEESPQGIHELGQEEQGGFLGRLKKECCFIWSWVFGLELGVFCHGSLGLEQRVGVEQIKERNGE